MVVQGYEVTSEEQMVSRDVSLTDQHRVYAVAEHAPCHENHFSISMDAYLLSHGIAISHPLWSGRGVLPHGRMLKLRWAVMPIVDALNETESPVPEDIDRRLRRAFRVSIDALQWCRCLRVQE